VLLEKTHLKVHKKALYVGVEALTALRLGGFGRASNPAQCLAQGLQAAIVGGSGVVVAIRLFINRSHSSISAVGLVEKVRERRGARPGDEERMGGSSARSCSDKWSKTSRTQRM
jgi:hypothetical protein